MNSLAHELGTFKPEPELKLRALLVEDEPEVGSLFQKVFNLCGFEVERAASFIEALSLSGNEKFDLVLLDINLPDGNGLHLIPVIREANPEIEIITMTGDNPIWIEAKARELKVAYHLIKPFDLGELISILNHLAQKTICLSEAH